MAADDALALGGGSQHLTHALGHKPVARAVEAVAAHVVLGVILHGQGIHEGRLGHRLVEGGVKHAHLGNAGQHGLDGLDTSHVHGVVQRSNAVALAYHVLHLVGDEDAAAELLAAMHHAVTHGVDFLQILDAAIFRMNQRVEDSLDGTLVVGEAQVNVLLATVIKFQFDETVGQTDFFNTTLGQGLVLLDLDEFILGRTAATIQN